MIRWCLFAVFFLLLSPFASSSEGSSSEGSSGGHGEHVHPHIALLFPFLAILFGRVVMHVDSRTPKVTLPYTVSLFLVGIFLRILHIESDGALGNFSKSITMWMAIDPHLLLYAFLPALIFGDAMTINWHDFERCVAQCAILAGPGVLFGTCMMTVVAKYVFPYEWDTNRAAAFGAILAATDPVAVVGLLKEMGASRTLTMQIAGESLLNDGIAIVVWLVFYNMMNGKEYEAGDIVLLFLQLAAGGFVCGVVFGFIGVRWLSMVADKLVHSDHIVQLALTITVAYLAFFIGENELHVSGVLATLFAALMFGKAAWPLFCNSEGIEHVWHAIEFFGNTILFILCGIIFYASMRAVEAAAYGYLILLFVLATLARGTMIFCLYPFLNMVANYTAKTTWKECLVMTWGGLRGAVGLALALSMRQALIKLGTPHDGDLMVFFVGGIAGLTLLVNATTCGRLLQVLELTKSSDCRKHIIHQLTEKLIELGNSHHQTLHEVDQRFAAVEEKAFDQLAIHDEDAEEEEKDKDQEILEKMEELQEAEGEENKQYNKEELKKADTNFDGKLDANEILNMLTESGLEPEQMERALMKAINLQKMQRTKATKHWWWGFRPIPFSKSGITGSLNERKAVSVALHDWEELVVERELFLSMLYSEYTNQLKTGMLPEHAHGAHSLFASVDAAGDFTHLGLCDWVILKRDMLGQKKGAFDRLIQSSYKSYCLLHTHDHQYTFDLFTVVVFLDTHHIVCERLLEGDLGKPSAARMEIIRESGKQLNHVHQFLLENKVGVPQICWVRTKQLAVAVLLHQVHKVTEWHETGILSAKEAEHMHHCVHHALKHVEEMEESEHTDGVQGAEVKGWQVDYVRERLAAIKHRSFSRLASKTGTMKPAAAEAAKNAKTPAEAEAAKNAKNMDTE